MLGAWLAASSAGAATAASLAQIEITPLPGGRLGWLQDGQLHCAEVQHQRWRRCGHWPVLTLPADVRRVVSNERTLAIVHGQQVDFLDEAAELKPDHHRLTLPPGADVAQMVNGVYSTESEVVLWGDSQLVVQLPADPASNMERPLACPERAGAHVMGWGGRYWALLRQDGLSIVSLASKNTDKDSTSKSWVCKPIPGMQWQVPAGADELSIFNGETLAVRSGSLIQFLRFDAQQQQWSAAPQTPELDLAEVSSQASTPRPWNASPRKTREAQRAAARALADTLVPTRYAHAQAWPGGFIRVQALRDTRGDNNGEHKAAPALFGVLDAQGRELLPPIYRAVTHDERYQRFVVTGFAEGAEPRAERMGVIDEAGKVVLPLVYESIRRLSNGEDEPTAIVQRSGQFGYANIVTGRLHIPPQYDALVTDSLMTDVDGEGLLFARRGERWALLNTQGEALTEFEFEGLRYRSSGQVEARRQGQPELLRVDGLRLVGREPLPPETEPRAQAFGGIGAGFDFQKVPGQVFVRQLLPQAPAEAAGLKAGDQLLAVDGQPVGGWSEARVVAAIRGTPGSLVRLQIQRGKQRLTLKITRALLSAR